MPDPMVLMVSVQTLEILTFCTKVVFIYLKVGEKVITQGLDGSGYRHITVQLNQTWKTNLGSVFTDVSLSEIELPETS